MPWQVVSGNEGSNVISPVDISLPCFPSPLRHPGHHHPLGFKLRTCQLLRGPGRTGSEINNFLPHPEDPHSEEALGSPGISCAQSWGCDAEKCCFLTWGIICWAFTTSPHSSLERNWIKYAKNWWTVLETPQGYQIFTWGAEGGSGPTLLLVYHIIDALEQLWGSHLLSELGWVVFSHETTSFLETSKNLFLCQTFGFFLSRNLLMVLNKRTT